MISIEFSRPFPGETRIALNIGSIRIRFQYLGWLWTKSLVSFHIPTANPQFFGSARLLWFDVSVWRRPSTPPRFLSSVSRLSIVSRIAHDLAEMRRSS